MNYGIITDPSAATVTCVQSADPVDLQNLINAVLAASTEVLASITLAGGGDGHTFIAMIETAPDTDMSGGLDVEEVVVRCYLASTGEDLVLAKVAIGIPPALLAPPGPSIPFVLLDEQVAGSSKGTRFMGLSVFSAAEGTLTVNLPIAAAAVSGVLDSVDGDTITTLSALSAVGFSLVGTQVLKYDGGVAIDALIDASVTVSLLVTPGPFTVEIVRDPLGLPVVLAAVSGTVDVAGGSENVSVTWFGQLLPTALSAIQDRLGIRVISPLTTAGSVLAGNFRVAAR